MCSDMVNIAQRPPEADDRRVPGHWEGDLLIGKRNATAIATLVERASGFAMLVPLPDGYKPEHVAPALTRKVQTLPDALRRSLTWDQGPEMRDWKHMHVDAGIDVFFCDPHAPLATRLQREHQRPPQAVLPEGLRLLDGHRGRARRRRRRAQRATAQAPRVRQPHRTPHRAAVAMTARIRRWLSGMRASALPRKAPLPSAGLEAAGI